MTAKITWGWEAPRQYYTTYGGATIKLPNGDWIDDFGDPTHQFPENLPWDFHNTGEAFVEVNPEGQIMRTFTFPVGWYVYRIDALTSKPPSKMLDQTVTGGPNTLALLSIVVIPVAIILLLAVIIIRRRMKGGNRQK
jgi:hypothetical protein